MARIRSVHPELFTDEEFASISVSARLLLIGLGTLADDQGVFQWKPVAIRLKIFPLDPLDVQELLAELERVKLIERFEDDENRVFGAVRNFCEHQSPRRSNAKFPITERIAQFVKLHKNRDLGVPAPDNVRTCPAGEGEERKGKGRGEERSIPPIIPREAFDRLIEHRTKQEGRKPSEYAISRLISKLERLAAEGNSPERVIEQTIENNWKGVFPLKGEYREQGDRSSSGNGLLDAARGG